jgi:nicotinamidase-related amidase
MATALMIVDMQAGLFARAPLPFDLPGVIGRINQLARRARASGAPVILVQHEAAGTALEYGSPGWQLDRRIDTDVRDIRLRKRTSAPYASSRLQALLDERAVRGVAIAGYATEFCIDSTVRWTASLGYDVTLVSDAHTTHDKPHLDAAGIIAHHNATLPAIRSLGAAIVASPAATLWPAADEARAAPGTTAPDHATGSADGLAAASFDDLISAFEWVSADPGAENAAYVCRTTGRVFWVFPDADDTDELPDDLDDGTRYLAVPHKHDLDLDLDLGNALALRFVDEFVPQRYAAAANFFRRPGAYRNLKAMLEREGRLEAWYAFQAAAVEKALHDWAAENHLPMAPPASRPDAARPATAGHVAAVGLPRRSGRA